MKRIAFIIIRYGKDVNGGAEAHCRMLAERLTPYYEVEVLTTTIRIFNDPTQDFKEGTSTENGVLIRRFKPRPVNAELHNDYYKHGKLARRIRSRLHRLGILRLFSSLHPHWSLGVEAERRTIESQPSHTPEMFDFIRQHRDLYHAFIFMNFYSSQTILGAAIAPEKSILIPLAHPENPLYYGINVPMFTRVRHIAFNTSAEEQLCRRIFGRSMAPCSLVGCGIEEAEPADWEEVKKRYMLPERYVLYLGRVTGPKINQIIPEFLKYKQQYGGDVKLVLVGGIDDKTIRHPASNEVILTGFVSEAEKSAIIRHASVMVNPSHLESLSLLMLEAMQNRIPVLVNGKSKVMKDHCKISGAALWYNNWRDFRKKLHRLLFDSELRQSMTEKGPRYVQDHYEWKIIIGKLREIIDSI